MSYKDFKLDLMQFASIRTLITNRSIQLVFTIFMLFVYTFAIMTGFLGSQVGSANFSTIFVWVVWWGLLFSMFIPFLGRTWCSICPIPLFGDFLQRGSINEGGNSHTSFSFLKNKNFPRKLQNLWLSTVLFALFGLFAGKITTSPYLTAIILTAFLLGATLIAVYFKKRTFCRYICPIGGTIGIYSQLAPLELRVKNTQVCRDHKSKNCLKGNEDGYGCNWMQYPGKLENNMNCGLCLECIRTCDQDNISLNIRSYNFLDFRQSRNLDEGFRFIFLLSASLMYLVIFYNPFTRITNASNFSSFQQFYQFSSFFLLVTGVIIPIIFAIPAYIVSKGYTSRQLNTKTIFSNYSFATAPLSLSSWAVFSLLTVKNNWAYSLNVLNDPFGIGWSIFGWSHLENVSLSSGVFSFLIIAFILGGIVFSLQILRRITTQSFAGDDSTGLFLDISYGLLITCFGIGTMFLFLS